MSSSKRLKRKLEDLGVDLASGKANENFCLIGTPLPPLEKSKKDAGEFVPLWKQEVRDEKGRRRLHGAFTGGFSAGYFNTVGSKEGWTPSTFVSSRSDRAKQKAARPEDFMDEEDLQDIKDSRTIVDTADEMDLTGASGQPSVEDKESDSLAAALEASMLPPPSDSAGARILKKMGWRLGQGIGPRLTFQQRKVQDGELGVAAPQKDEEDAEAQKHLYPRRDTKVMLFDRKDNSWGLGYSPGMGLNESVGLSGQGKKSEPKGPRLAAGFGLGALNDADDDDVDVYDPITGHTSHRRREAYDFAHEQEDEGMHSITKGGRYMRQSTSSTNNPMVPRFFRDGQPVLQGFSLSNKAVMEDRWFPLPEVPKGWMPDPKRVWEKKDDASKKENKENVPQVGQGAKSAWDAKMSADERGQMLGETPLPAAPRSVFDFMSKKDRERLESIKSNLSAGQAKVPPTPYAEDDSSPPGSLPYTMPRTEPHIAQAALRGFRPFAADPAKQARYETYLESQLLPTDGGVPKPELKALPTQKSDEFRKEVEDYAKAALLFKPMSGAMAGRFQSAGVVEMAKPEEGFRSGSGEAGENDGEVQANKKAPAPAAEREDPKVHAAKMGMYGGLTRETKLWIPARLLCKRFGVKDPEVSLPEGMDAPGPSSSTNTTSSWQTGQTEFTSNFGTSAGSGAGASQPNEPDDEASGNKKNGRRDLANVGLGEDDDQGRDTLTYERPSMEVFKAIFASDDEDDDDEDVKEDLPEPSLAATTGETGPLVSQPTLTNQNEPVDLSTFKPTFIPRAGKDKEKDAEKLAKKEKKKKDKKAKAVLSFEMDEDGGGLEVKPERPKKKKKKDKSEGETEKEKGSSKPAAVEEDDDMWVEKPVADAVKDLPPTSASVPTERRDGEMMEVEAPTNGGSGPRGRKRAIDFL